MSICIEVVENSRQRNDFITFPWRIYADDPNWVPPLLFERRQFLDKRKNPFFQEGEANLFLARQGRELVGRISAQLHHAHLKRHQDETGFFGFFECVEDPTVAQALVVAAQEWLHQKGMKKIRGPFSFTINHESGLLVEGFDSPPFLLMPHNPSYYAKLLEGQKFQKCKDLYAWHYVAKEFSPEVAQLAEATKSYPGLKIRSLNPKKYYEEIALMVDLFNEIWGNNWGFVPISKKEAHHMAKELKPILVRDMVYFAEIDGDPAAFSMAIPNINEALHDLNGKLFPFGWLKLLWRLKMKKIHSARLALLGIRKPYRGGALGALSVLLYCEAQRRSVPHGYTMGELSWTLEDNEKINRGIEFMGARKYKTYRIYEKALS